MIPNSQELKRMVSLFYEEKLIGYRRTQRFKWVGSRFKFIPLLLPPPLLLPLPLVQVRALPLLRSLFHPVVISQGEQIPWIFQGKFIIDRIQQLIGYNPTFTSSSSGESASPFFFPGRSPNHLGSLAIKT